LSTFAYYFWEKNLTLLFQPRIEGGRKQANRIFEQEVTELPEEQRTPQSGERMNSANTGVFGFSHKFMAKSVNNGRF
jgi:hypothetical protein